MTDGRAPAEREIPVSRLRMSHAIGIVRHVNRATVLGVSFDEGIAIYLWLLLDGPEPRYYRLPWRPRCSHRRCRTYVDEASRKGAQVMLQNPFTKRSFDDLGDLNVKIVLPPPLPGKLPPPPPRVVNPGERSA